MACVCNRYNARSDWLILGRYSPVKLSGRLRTCKNKTKGDQKNFFSEILTWLKTMSDGNTLVVNSITLPDGQKKISNP